METYSGSLKSADVIVIQGHGKADDGSGRYVARGLNGCRLHINFNVDTVYSEDDWAASTFGLPKTSTAVHLNAAIVRDFQTIPKHRLLTFDSYDGACSVSSKNPPVCLRDEYYFENKNPLFFAGDNEPENFTAWEALRIVAQKVHINEYVFSADSMVVGREGKKRAVLSGEFAGVYVNAIFHPFHERNAELSIKDYLIRALQLFPGSDCKK